VAWPAGENKGDSATGNQARRDKEKKTLAKRKEKKDKTRNTTSPPKPTILIHLPPGVVRIAAALPTRVVVELM